MGDEQKPTEKVVPVYLHDEVKSSFLDYAMSVIVSRALPDVRDGMKPVHRRILYAMSEMGLSPDKPHRKSARIVGEVLGKFHPHGDVAVYEALARLAQDFVSRYPMVDGHGNFGSIDGDPPAAMRYTEARMSRISEEMLTEINKNTVDFRPNFDESLQEPVVLPSRYPNLLVNGSAGIAVGMATNIPPHNLGEVIDALNYLINHPQAEVKDLMYFVKGPDFPTGGDILGDEGIRNAYENGRGIIKTRGKVFLEEKSKGKKQVVIKEVPFQQNKSKLIEKIAELAREKKIEGITDLRDESDRDGIRIVLEVKKEFHSQVIVNQLFKYTPLQQTYGMILLALVNGQPRILSLRDLLVHYLEHQKEVIVRRTRYDLKRAEERAHIVEGLRIALNYLDEVIKTIRTSNDVNTARQRLQEGFELTEKQAQAILDMRLQKLTALERDKLESEYKELLEKIDYYRKVLDDESLVLRIVQEELSEIKRKHADKRKTSIIENEEALDVTDLIKEEEVVVLLTQQGYIKRMPLSSYKSQRRGGRGIAGTVTRENDFVKQMHVVSTHSNLLCFSNKGKVYQLKTHEIPETSRQARGTPLINLLAMEKKEFISAVMPIVDFQKDQFLLKVTSRGMVKKTPVNDFKSTRKSGIIAIKLGEGEELMDVLLVDHGDSLVICNQKGHFISFNQEEIRSMGRSARGVTGMKLSKEDKIVGVDVIKKGREEECNYLLMITEKGFGKRVETSELRSQKRGGKGVIGIKTDERRGKVASFELVSEKDDVIIATAKGIILRQKAGQVPIQSRYSLGVTLIKVGNNDRVVNMVNIEHGLKEVVHEK